MDTHTLGCRPPEAGSRVSVPSEWGSAGLLWGRRRPRPQVCLEVVPVSLRLVCLWRFYFFFSFVGVLFPQVTCYVFKTI